jgi:Ca2+-binding EF-hand superfamily protein
MSQLQWVRRSLPLAVLAALAWGPLVFADDIAAFATGGYARGLRTMDQMHKIDTDGDGTVSKAEWLTYQEQVWAAFPKDKSGNVDEKSFTTRSGAMVSFATGGYARGLQTQAMMHRIDADSDGTISHDEFINYQTKIFEMMDTNHTGSLGPQEFLGK